MTSVPHFLSTLNLVQERPRVRSILAGSWGLGDIIKPIPLAFPWVSFGYHPLSTLPQGYEGSHKFINMFFHNRPWTDIDDAAEILRVPTISTNFVMHNFPNGTCCVRRERFVSLIDARHQTPSQAFFNSVNPNLQDQKHDLPERMRDIKHPDRVLKTEWPAIQFARNFNFNRHIEGPLWRSPLT